MENAAEYILIDSNILLRNEQKPHVQHAITVQALKILRERGITVCIVPQNLYEFWNVCTRPEDRNGLGRTIEETERFINDYFVLFTFLRDPLELFEAWLDIVAQNSVKGTQVHDARLVAAMTLHGIPTILTHNADDFRCYSFIDVITPAEVALTADD